MNKVKVIAMTKILNRLSNTIKVYPRDTHMFMNAENKYLSLIYGIMPPQDYGLISKYLGRKLSNRDFAKEIIAHQYNTDKNIFHLPVSILATLVLRQCQRELHLTQSEFARRYDVPQAKMSKMESGQQKTDIDILQRILHDTHHKFVIE